VVANNPAGRLLDLIAEGDKLRGQKLKSAAAWARILDVPEDNRGLLLQRVGPVLGLPNEIRLAVEALNDVDHDLMLERQDQVVIALQRPLESQWDDVLSTLDETTRYSLRHISDRLSRSSEEPSIEEAELKRLLTSVRELIDEVTAAGLPTDFRSTLLRALRTIELALLEARVRGAEGIQSAVETAVGVMAFGYRPQEDEGNGEKSRFWGRTVGLVERVALIVSLSLHSLTAGQQVGLLPAAPSPAAGPQRLVQVDEAGDDPVALEDQAPLDVDPTAPSNQ
jgi:hypothetical protein